MVPKYVLIYYLLARPHLEGIRLVLYYCDLPPTGYMFNKIISRTVVWSMNSGHHA